MGEWLGANHFQEGLHPRADLARSGRPVLPFQVEQGDVVLLQGLGGELAEPGPVITELEAGTDDAVDAPIPDHLCEEVVVVVEGVHDRWARQAAGVPVGDGQDGVLGLFVAVPLIVACPETEIVRHDPRPPEALGSFWPPWCEPTA